MTQKPIKTTASNPIIAPCPICKTDENIEVYKYENGWTHVECLKCNYLGPGEGNSGAAIKAHNLRQQEKS